MIKDDIETLFKRRPVLKTDADYADFLQETERLRKEVQRHSDTNIATRLLDILNNLVEDILSTLD